MLPLPGLTEHKKLPSKRVWRLTQQIVKELTTDYTDDTDDGPPKVSGAYITTKFADG